MTPSLAIKINAVAATIVCGVLLGAFGIQLFGHELPCPLCLLQRMAMLGVVSGALLNVRFGPHPAYYGISLLSAVLGLLVSGRQVLLHIVPPDPGFGAAVWGLHLYTWAAVVFLVAVLAIGVMLLFPGQFATPAPSTLDHRLGSAMLALVAIIAFGNAVSALLECGLLACPDDPTRYVLLP